MALKKIPTNYTWKLLKTTINIIFRANVELHQYVYFILC